MEQFNVIEYRFEKVCISLTFWLLLILMYADVIFTGTLGKRHQLTFIVCWTKCADTSPAVSSSRNVVFGTKVPGKSKIFNERNCNEYNRKLFSFIGVVLRLNLTILFRISHEATEFK